MIQLSLWDSVLETQEKRTPNPDLRHLCPNPQLLIANPESRISDPGLSTPSCGPRIATPESRIPNPKPKVPDSGLRTPHSELPTVFTRVFRRLRIYRPLPEFHVEYRAFVGLRSTIHLLGDQIQVRISDLLLEAPPIVVEALAEILLAQLFRRRPSREARECYMACVMSPPMRRRIDEARRTRGYKRLLPAQGRHFNLQAIFDDLNRRFFQGQLSASRIGWSPKRSRTILGHFDSSHGTITISSLFDSPSVPRYLVEYLLFHEMLHIRYPVERNGHRRVVHSKAFREAEKRFPHYEQAYQRLRWRSRAKGRGKGSGVTN